MAEAANKTLGVKIVTRKKKSKTPGEPDKWLLYQRTRIPDEELEAADEKLRLWLERRRRRKYREAKLDVSGVSSWNSLEEANAAKEQLRKALEKGAETIEEMT